MNNFFRPDPKQTRVLAAFYFIVGLIIAIFARRLIVWTIRCAGIFAIVYGAYQLYLYYGRNSQYNSSALIFGVPSIIVGLILAVWPNLLVNIFPIAIGIILVINSLIGIQKAMALKSAGFPNWTLSLVGALLMLGAGIFLAVYPERSVDMVFRITGIALIFEGVLMFFNSVEQSRYN